MGANTGPENTWSASMGPANEGPANAGPAAGGTGTDTLDRELEELIANEQLEEGDHERFSHYVPKNKIMESALTGKPVRALCGKLWTPGRDPEKFPVCPTCKEVYEKMKP
jgi:hypothetical protein